MRRSSRGTALLEFAIALPLLVAISFASIDGARALATWSRVKNGAREGASFAQYFPLRQQATGALCTDPNNITSRVQREGADLLVAVTPAASPSCQDLTTGSSLQAGDAVTVTVTKTFTFITPLASVIWGAPDIHASVTTRVQG